MADIEKVINCLTDIENIMITRQEICPREELQYWIELQEGVADALELLKEQGAVQPVSDKTGRIWLCGKCGLYVGYEDNDPDDPNEFDKYCRNCGTPVLWEGR